MLTDGGDTDRERLTYGFRLVTARYPSVTELETLATGYRRRQQLFAENPEAAKQFINHGQAKTTLDVPTEQLAAYTATASILLNLDEAITKGVIPMRKLEPLATAQQLNRRHFLSATGTALGATALQSLLHADVSSASALPSAPQANSEIVPRAKRVIYLFQSGAPSQFETFDYKPKLAEMTGEDLPDFDPSGPTAHDDDIWPGEVPDRALDFQVRPAWTKWGVGQRSAALHRRRGR